jgi:MFS transporter, PHS family, inorganic phosphate transporter
MKRAEQDEIAVEGQPPVSTVTYKNDIRRVALSEIDNVPISWPHIRAVIVAGTDFFTDPYDLFSTNFITTMIGLAFYDSHVIPSQADTAIKLSTTAGAVIGQVLFGWLADKFGRKRMYGIELIIILIGTFGRLFPARDLELLY